MLTPEPTRPDPDTEREREEKRRRERPPVELPPQQPRKPEIELPKKEDEVTEGDWNPTPRRRPVQVPRNDCGMSSCLRSSL